MMFLRFCARPSYNVREAFCGWWNTKYYTIYIQFWFLVVEFVSRTDRLRSLTHTNEFIYCRTGRISEHSRTYRLLCLQHLIAWSMYIYSRINTPITLAYIATPSHPLWHKQTRKSNTKIQQNAIKYLTIQQLLFGPTTHWSSLLRSASLRHIVNADKIGHCFQCFAVWVGALRTVCTRYRKHGGYFQH